MANDDKVYYYSIINTLYTSKEVTYIQENLRALIDLIDLRPYESPIPYEFDFFGSFYAIIEKYTIEDIIIILKTLQYISQLFNSIITRIEYSEPIGISLILRLAYNESTKGRSNQTAA